MHLLELLVSEECHHCTAVCYDDDRRKVYVTYHYLLECSRELAGALRQHVKTGQLVAIFTPPSVDMLVAILGILAIPAAYVPISHHQPAKATINLMERLHISVVIVHVKTLKEFLCFPWHNVATINCLFHYGELCVYSLVPHSDQVLGNTATQTEDLAYVMTTSGTTGLPKLVRVPHCCIVPNIVDLRQRFDVTSNDTVFNAAPYTFDPSVVEMFLALSSGATLLVIPEAAKASPTQLATLLFARNTPTIIQATPSLLCSLGTEILCDKLLGCRSHVRVLAFGGEACPSPRTILQWRDVSNDTRIFNIYGITEVSSWAMCYELTGSDGVLSGVCDDNVVPLGNPLLDTIVELHNDNGDVMTSGNGQIWIGGGTRVCLLDDEEEIVAGIMRPSGDHGRCGSDGLLYYVGRVDKQVKRLGHRINLDTIQQIISSIPCVKSCALTHLDRPHNRRDSSSLVLFVVPTTQHNNDDTFLHDLHHSMSKLLPTHCIPDDIVTMDILPVTSHGKVDIARLCHDSLKDKNCFVSDSVDMGCVASMEKWLSSLAELVGVSGWKAGVNFLQIGGDSFQLVRIMNLIEDGLGSEVNISSILGKFMDTALNKSLCDAAKCLFEHINKCDNKTTEVHQDDILDGPVPKRQKFSVNEPQRKQISFRRGHCYVNSRLMMLRLCIIPDHPTPPVFKLDISWKVDTQKCVDASPLVVSQDDGVWVVYIGSHSGLFYAINVTTGVVVWETLLTDRIMSSAVLSLCGNYVIVGCHDGCLYTLCTTTGTTYWCLCVSSEPVRSSPCVDIATGLVWFGSHDHHLYAVNIEHKQVIHKVPIDGGIVMSSPLIDNKLRQLYITTLAGSVAAINCDSTDIVWIHKCPKPVFASPSLLADHCIVVGCVDGDLLKYKSDGTMVNKIQMKKPIFESVCPYEVCKTSCGMDPMIPHGDGNLSLTEINPDSSSTNSQFFLFGGHDSCLSNVSSSQMDFTWSTKLDSAVGSTPFVGSIVTAQGHLSIACCCTISGNVCVVDLTTGKVVGRTQLPGEVFSSPVIVGDRIVVGCRDDNVYCLKISTS